MTTKTSTIMTNSVSDLYDNNNHIRVYWNDTSDNHTYAKEKEVERYFQKKYNTNKVKVVFRAITNKKDGVVIDDPDMRADASDLVLDDAFQKTLIEKFIKDGNIDVNMSFLNKLDTTVNSQLVEYKEHTNRYKTFKIKKIEFSNFLSYGEDNTIDIGDKPGITSIISDPPNFGGKTTLTIDLLLFLFFGVTTKSSKMEDIFNKYSESDTVTVKGTVEIEGDSFQIKRVITRKTTKDKGWKCESKLDFYQYLPKGGTKLLNGEQRKFTEELIKTYVGTQDDFLITILTTGDNLDDLIKTKPTERGRLLTRFIGLEFFREKEKVAKKLYDDWKKTSNLYNNSVDDILTKIESEESRIKQNEELNLVNSFSLTKAKENLKNIEDHRDTLTRTRNNNVDVELYKTNENTITEGVEKLERLIAEKNTTLSQLEKNAIQPTNEFDVDTYQVLNMKEKGLNTDILTHQFTIRNNEKTIQLLRDNEICQTCMRPLEGVDNTGKIDELCKANVELNDLISELNLQLVETKKGITNFDDIKSQWESYNRNELILSKAKNELSQYSESLARGKDKLKQYRDNIQNIEQNKKIDTELEGIKNKIINANNEKDSIMLQIRSIEKDIESSKDRINGYNNLIKELKKEEVIDKIYRVYLEIYGKNGISKMILGTMIPLINNYLKTLLIDTTEFILELRMDDKGDVEFWMIDNLTYVEKPLFSGSGFEKTVGLLALRCVLRKVCSLPKPNFIAFDEVTGKVANENLEKLGLFFDKIKLYFEHIWIISHNPLVQDWADNVIKITKVNDISKVINENN